MFKLTHFLLTFAAFLAIDLVWLGIVAKNFYRNELGELMRPTPNWPAALAFYALYVLGVLLLVVYPNLDQGAGKVFLWGAFFGFVAYATFDLTALAILRDWPIKMTIVDLIWGAALTGSVSWIGFQIVTNLK